MSITSLIPPKMIFKNIRSELSKTVLPQLWEDVRKHGLPYVTIMVMAFFFWKEVGEIKALYQNCNENVQQLLVQNNEKLMQMNERQLQVIQENAVALEKLEQKYK